MIFLKNTSPDAEILSSPFEAIAQYPYDQACYRFENYQSMPNIFPLYPSMGLKLLEPSVQQITSYNTTFYNLNFSPLKAQLFPENLRSDQMSYYYKAPII